MRVIVDNDWPVILGSERYNGLVFDANDRCDQENLIGQLKSGLGAMRMPLDNLYSNWVYLVAWSLAWT